MIYREAGQFRTSYAADQALFPIRQDRLFVWALIVFAFLFVPFLVSEYLLRAILIPFVILAIAAIGLNLLVGYCGQISLGSAAFMAVGAYASYDIAVHLPGDRKSTRLNSSHANISYAVFCLKKKKKKKKNNTLLYNIR